MSLREAEGPLGTVDLPVPEAAPEAAPVRIRETEMEPEVAPEQAETGIRPGSLRYPL